LWPDDRSGHGERASRAAKVSGTFFPGEPVAAVLVSEVSEVPGTFPGQASDRNKSIKRVTTHQQPITNNQQPLKG
jgi:hypothetical protein